MVENNEESNEESNKPAVGKWEYVDVSDEKVRQCRIELEKENISLIQQENMLKLNIMKKEHSIPMILNKRDLSRYENNIKSIQTKIKGFDKESEEYDDDLIIAQHDILYNEGLILTKQYEIDKRIPLRELETDRVEIDDSITTSKNNIKVYKNIIRTKKRKVQIPMTRVTS